MKICLECCQQVLDDKSLYQECSECCQKRLQEETEVLCYLEYKYLNDDGLENHA